MDPIESGFSRRRWELSAAKSQVLLTGAETAANRALALALLELVVRRALRLVTTEDRILFFSRRRIVVVRDDRVSIPFHHDLDTVLRECDPSRRYADGTAGVSVAEIVKRLQRTYRGRGGFVPGVVLPALKDRGFFQQEVYSRLGIFPRSRWTITGDGIQALSELSELMFIGRGRFNEW